MVNRRYPRLEVTGNFLLGEALPASHWTGLAALLGHHPARPCGKGWPLLLAPAGNGTPALLARFRQLQQRSRLPTALYLIQRL